MLHRTEAITLRSMDYGETSQIATLYTLSMGKVSVLAKGSRLPTSQFGSTLQPLSHIQAIFYVKPSRTLYLLRESTHTHRYARILRDIERTTLGLQLLETSLLLLPEQEPFPSAFHLLCATLNALDTTTQHFANLAPFYTLRLTGLLGFQPHIHREHVHQLPETGGFFDRATGRIQSTTEGLVAPIAASRPALRALTVMALGDMATVLGMILSPTLYAEVESLVHQFVHYHIESFHPLRSSKVAEQLKNYSGFSSR